MRYSDEQRIKKIYEYATRLQQYIEDKEITKEALLSDYSLQWLVTTPLYNIGEHVYNLSKEYKIEHSEVPWAMIAGLRHRLVHDYDGTNWNIIVEVVFEEIPALIVQIEKLSKGV
jgi:uncharacterized protein with HEPN domain